MIKGSHHSSETKNKISKAGKSFWETFDSTDRNRKISFSQKGRPLTEETKKKISLAHCGKPKPWKRGENNYFWKGGVTKTNWSIRMSMAYSEWRKKIFERDGFTCQVCGVKGGKLNADHYPQTFSEIIEKFNIKSLDEAMNCPDLWNLKNNRTICVNCHRLTPTYGVNIKYLNSIV